MEVFTKEKIITLKGTGTDLEQLIVPDGQSSHWSGESSYKKNWDLSLSIPAKIAGTFQLDKTVYKAGPLLKKTQEFYPEQIWLLLNQELTRGRLAGTLSTPAQNRSGRPDTHCRSFLVLFQ